MQAMASAGVATDIQGEFIAILNSDDFAPPGRLAAQVAFLRENPQVGAVLRCRALSTIGASPPRASSTLSSHSRCPTSRAARGLGHFFFHGNCLCAPTAMVRRCVYQRAVEYDPRLTSLQDLDMWVRVSAAHDIHVLHEELTAYRIRAGEANMSAPRPDTRLRSEFDTRRAPEWRFGLA
jgi:hypothetical protein